ncbi:MAG: 30S ribosomal protein S8 [Clostridiales bacterium]|jgi:small subunit ribosomal protein S8|nr:30S ribosomal protein S8 [Clostridiales bacterium]
MVIDPIADFLTRIRNALTAKHTSVEIPASKIKKQIADILVEEGYVKSAKLEGEGKDAKIIIELKYGPKYERVLTNLQRISKPGLRVYCSYKEIPKVLNGLGIAILSTSKGIMTDKKARQYKVGGEVLAYVW